jgi:hypothetical protein
MKKINIQGYKKKKINLKGNSKLLKWWRTRMTAGKDWVFLCVVHGSKVEKKMLCYLL